MPQDPLPLRAFAFDLLGTTVDFYRPMMRMGAAVNEAKGLALDWSVLLTDWHKAFQAAIKAVVDGGRPWQSTDAIYRETFKPILVRFGAADKLSEDEREIIIGGWTQLDPWPDCVEGLTRLRHHFTLTVLSNVAMASAVEIVKRAALPFDCVLSGELVKGFKPASSVFQLAIDSLGVAPSQILMVSSEKSELFAAKAFGMRTAFVPRRLALGPNGQPDVKPDPLFDLNATDFDNLASQMHTVEIAHQPGGFAYSRAFAAAYPVSRD